MAIQTMGLDSIDSGSAGNSVYDDQAGEDYASITLEFVALINKWIVICVRGTWHVT